MSVVAECGEAARRCSDGVEEMPEPPLVHAQRRQQRIRRGRRRWLGLREATTASVVAADLNEREIWR